jgi:hypothetical protein
MKQRYQCESNINIGKPLKNMLEFSSTLSLIKQNGQKEKRTKKNDVDSFARVELKVQQ